MIVHDDDSCSRFDNGGPEHFARMHQRAVEQAASDEHFPQHLALTVQSDEMELLHLEIPQPTPEQTNYVLRFPDPLHRRALLPGRSGPQLECREEASRLGRPYARRSEQLG